MKPGEKDKRIDERDHSTNVPADAAPRGTRRRMQNRTEDAAAEPDRADAGQEPFDPTSRGDENGEVM